FDNYWLLSVCDGNWQRAFSLYRPRSRLSFRVDRATPGRCWRIFVRTTVSGICLYPRISAADVCACDRHWYSGRLGNPATDADHSRTLRFPRCCRSRAHFRLSGSARRVATVSCSSCPLFLTIHLQFSSRDEYRYHEALIHPGLSAIPAPRRVLVLGGGDGLAVREILKYPQIESITLVDLDPEMTRLFSTHPMLTALNQKSFSASRVHIINADAFPWVDSDTESFDFIVIDFPDPTNYSLGKLYSTTFD